MLLRSFTESGARAARFASVYGIVGTLLIPLNYFVIDLLQGRSMHPDNIERACHLQLEQETWEPIGSILVKLGLVSERDVVRADTLIQAQRDFFGAHGFEQPLV